MSENSVKATLEVLLIPMAVFAGFLLKRKDIENKSDKWVYVICSTLTAYTAPDFIIAFFPTLTENAKGFIIFVSAIFGGLIILNIWRLLSNELVWQSALSMFIKTGKKDE
jgi:hypothetical protein